MALGKNKIIIIAVAAVLAVSLLGCAGVVLVINLYAAGGGDNIEIPDVVGMPVAEARDAISIRTEIVIVEADAPEGMVVGQSHAPGTKTHHDDIVRLDVSGPLEVPDLVGTDVKDAWQVLYAAGFDDMTYEYDAASAEPEGTVVDQDPEPGAASDTGEITFTIAGADPYP